MKIFFFLIFFSISCSTFAFDATYYADSFEGKKTANGDVFSQESFSAAICDTPLGGYAYVSTASTGVVVTLNDRPNCKKYPDIIDLSKSAFLPFDALSAGRVKNVGVQILASGSFPKREIYSQNSFMSLGVSLSQKIANTYFTEDGILISGKVIDGGSNVVVFLQKKDTAVPTYSTAFPVMNGNFSVSLKFPKEPGEYDFVILSSTQVQNSMFSLKDAKSIFLIEPNTFSYPKKNTISFGKSLPKHIHPKNTVPYISFGDNIWGVFRIEQDSKITTATGQIFMPDSYGFRTGGANFYFSGSSLSTVSSLDQNPVGIISSGSIFLDKIRYNQDGQDKVNLRILKNVIIFRFKIPKGEKVEPQYYITLPNGDVLVQEFDKKYIDFENSKLLKTGIIITATFPINKGIYRLEVNNNRGFAYFNIPVYANGIGAPILQTISDSDITKITTNTGIVQRDVLILINRLRSSLGRGLFSLDNDLSKIAQAKASYMRDNDDLNHVTRDGRTIDDFAKMLGLNISGLSENIAGGTVSHLVLQDGLEESGSHRFSIINPKWTKMGIGYAVKNGKTYLVQVFSE